MPILQAQSATDYWKKGFAAFRTKNYSVAIQNFKEYDRLVPKKANAQFFIAKSYDLLYQLDSAIFFYDKTLLYHKSIHPNKVAIQKLSRAYLRQKDFMNAYQTAKKSILEIETDPVLDLEFQDICLWSYLTKNRNLDINYLTKPSKQISYIVKTITEQKVIARNLISEQGVSFTPNTRRNVGFAERWYGYFDNPEEVISIHFVFINKEFMTEVEAQDQNAMEVFKNTSNPMFERLGALYAMMPLDKKKMSIIMEYTDPMIRYCACKEMRSDIPKKYQKLCLKDEREIVKKAVKANPAFKFAY
jgi:tetratricopeptide (TPR) repeat protein